MIPLKRIFGIPLRMHFAFPLLLIAMLVLEKGAMIFAMLLSLTLHEAGHALCAGLLGVKISSIELMPFGGVMQMEEPHQLSPRQGVLISLAGPLVSIVFALLPFMLGLKGTFAREFLRSSCLLAATNLMPVLPLDGGRALCAMFSPRLGRVRATMLLVRAGVVLGGGFGLLGVFAAVHGVVNPMLFLTGAYLAYAALKEKDTLPAAQIAALHGRARRLEKLGMLPVRVVAIRQGEAAQTLAMRLTPGSYHLFIPVDRELRRTGIIDEGQVLSEFLNEFHLR